MHRWGRLFSGFWTSPGIVGQPVETKCLGAYLLGCPHGNMLGCFRLPTAYVVEDLRMSFETVSEGFRNLSDNSFLTRDSDLSWVLINRHLKWNPIENPNQGKAAMKLFEQVPVTSSVYAPLVQMLKDYPANFPAELLNRFQTAAEPFRNQEKEKEKDPRQEPYQEPQPEGITAHMIAKEVLTRSKISSDPVFIAVQSQAQLEIGAGDADEEVADRIIESMALAWAKFRANVGKMEYAWTAQKFFGEGYWRDETGWPWKTEVQLRASSKGSGSFSDRYSERAIA